MVYIVGIVGLVCGFIAGQMVLFALLRHRSREDLLNDPGLKWRYGTLNWLIAIAVCYFAISSYKFYFPSLPTPENPGVSAQP